MLALYFSFQADCHGYGRFRNRAETGIIEEILGNFF